MRLRAHAHVCAGRLKCWGQGTNGQLGTGNANNLGDGSNEMQNLQTISVGSGHTVVEVSCGRKHVCAILSDGALRCWGKNDKGQLGLGNAADTTSSTPSALSAVDLGTGMTAVAVACGREHTCAILKDGSVKCWHAGADRICDVACVCVAAGR